MDNPFQSPAIISFCPGILGLERGLARAGVECRVMAYVEIEAFIIANLVAGMEAGMVGPAPIWTDAKTFDAGPFRGRVHGIIGGYPCFPKGTMVLTSEGYKPIESVTTSDYVLTHKGRWRRVIATSDNGIAAIREIKAQGVSVKTTDEHPFFAREQKQIWANEIRRYTQKFDDPNWVNAKDLSNQYLSQVLPESTQTEYTSEFWWVIGRYIADGWSQWSPSRRHKKGGRITICCNHNESDDLEKRIRAAGFAPYKNRERTATRFSITEHWVYEFVQQFGQGASGKTINKTILELPTNKARGFMDGYISGDGYRQLSKGKYSVIRISSCSESLAMGIALLAQRTHGVVASISKSNRPNKHIIEGRTVNQLPSWEVSIPRQNKSAKIEGRYGWKKVKSNKTIGSERVYNITVDEDKSYITNGAIVHNCPGESLAGLREGHLYKGFIWPSIRRSIAAAGPLWCFFENVDDHLTGTYPIVQRSLYNMGYSVEAGVFSAEEVGAPHQRKRLFILAIRKELAYSNGVRQQIFGAIRFPQESSDDRTSNPSSMVFPKGQGFEQYEWEHPRTIESGMGINASRNENRVDFFHLNKKYEVYTAEKERSIKGLHELWEAINKETNKWTFGGLFCFLEKEILQSPVLCKIKNKRISLIGSNPEKVLSLTKGFLRDMWFKKIIEYPSQRQECFEQLKREFADAMCILSYQATLARRQEAQTDSYDETMQYLWKNYENTWWDVPEALSTVQKIWRPISDKESWRKQIEIAYKSFRLEIFGTLFGYNFREDLLRAIGNSVVEQTAELAFRTLLMKHINNKTQL